MNLKKFHKLKLGEEDTMSIIPNVSPKVFSFSAIIVGYLLIDDLTANEQNALGNWLMLTAQVLCTNAFYKQVQAERNIMDKKEPSVEETIAVLKKMVCAMQKEIDELKKEL
jgi:hypothetical protein